MLRGENRILRAFALLHFFDRLRQELKKSLPRRGRNDLWLLSDNFAILPNVNGRSVHARRLARDFRGALQRSTDSSGKRFGFLFHLS